MTFPSLDISQDGQQFAYSRKENIRYVGTMTIFHYDNFPQFAYSRKENIRYVGTMTIFHYDNFPQSE